MSLKADSKALGKTDQPTLQQCLDDPGFWNLMGKQTWISELVPSSAWSKNQVGKTLDRFSFIRCCLGHIKSLHSLSAEFPGCLWWDTEPLEDLARLPTPG